MGETTVAYYSVKLRLAVAQTDFVGLSLYTLFMINKLEGISMADTILNISVIMMFRYIGTIN